MNETRLAVNRKAYSIKKQENKKSQFIYLLKTNVIIIITINVITMTMVFCLFKKCKKFVQNYQITVFVKEKNTSSCCYR